MIWNQFLSSRIQKRRMELEPLIEKMKGPDEFQKRAIIEELNRLEDRFPGLILQENEFLLGMNLEELQARLETARRLGEDGEFSNGFREFLFMIYLFLQELN